MVEVELLKEDLQSNELIVEGEYVSEEKMLNEWQWSEKLSYGSSFCFKSLLKFVIGLHETLRICVVDLLEFPRAPKSQEQGCSGQERSNEGTSQIDEA